MTWTPPSNEPPPAAGAKAIHPSPGRIVIMVCGGLLLLLSFLPFFQIDGDGGGSGFTFSSWTFEYGMAPFTLLIVAAGVAAAVLAAFSMFLGDKLPRNILGFSIEQLMLILAVSALVVTFCYLPMNREVIEGLVTFELGPGYWIDLLLTIGLLVGAILALVEFRRGGHRGALTPGLGEWHTAGGPGAPPMHPTPQSFPPPPPPPQA